MWRCWKQKQFGKIIFRSQTCHHLMPGIISVENAEAMYQSKYRQLLVCDWGRVHFRNSCVDPSFGISFPKDSVTCVGHCLPSLSTKTSLGTTCNARLGVMWKVLSCLSPALTMCLLGSSPGCHCGEIREPYDCLPGELWARGCPTSKPCPPHEGRCLGCAKGRGYHLLGDISMRHHAGASYLSLSCSILTTTLWRSHDQLSLLTWNLSLHRITCPWAHTWSRMSSESWLWIQSGSAFCLITLLPLEECWGMTGWDHWWGLLPVYLLRPCDCPSWLFPKSFLFFPWAPGSWSIFGSFRVMTFVLSFFCLLSLQGHTYSMWRFPG